MKTHRTRARLLASSMICTVAVAAAGSALAQDQGATVGELVVTGSRIPTQNLSSTSPLTVVNDREAKLQGTTGVESLLNTLPQVFANQAGQVSNGATGTATVDLRGLGPNRTLVLIDGKRMVPGDPAAPVADLNQIPGALVDHVEVVTGGASAVYGSDAVAGVVNFIMKRDFEGVRVDAEHSFYWHTNDNPVAKAMLTSAAPGIGATFPDHTVTDGGTWDITAIVGVNAPDGKGNATLYAGYRHTDAVSQASRDFTACATATNFDGTFRCSGSSNSISGRFISTDTGPNLNRRFTTTGVQGEMRPFVTATDVFNFGPTNYLQRPDQRYVAGGFAHYELSQMADVYTDVMFSDDHTIAQLAPSGLFQGSGPVLGGVFTFNCSNPFLGSGADPSSARSLFCTDQGLGATDDAHLLIGRRTVEIGPRQDNLRHTSYRIVLGLKGQLNDSWNYDLYGQYSDTIYAEEFLHDASASRIQRALHVVDVGGTPTCESVLDNSDPSCVPLNIFRLGGITQAAADYIAGTGFKEGSTRETVLNFSVTGDLTGMGLKSPAADSGVGVALGTEYRRENLDLRVSRDFETGDLTGQGGPTPSVNGGFQVYELFGEAKVPIVTDAPGIKLLEFDGGYRWSDYSGAGAVSTYKLAGEWAPISDVRLRASYQRAVRAPNVVELFTPQVVGLFAGVDPCSSDFTLFFGVTPTFAECARSGVTAANYGNIPGCPAAQCSGLFSGNAALKPEVSDTKSIGVVLTPTFLHGFSATVDWFDIDVKNAIGTTGGALTMAACVSGVNLAYCPLIHRSPGTGILFGSSGYVIQTTENTGFLATKGIDFDANYRTSLADWHLGDSGSIELNFVGTWTKSQRFAPASGSLDVGSYDCAGLYGVVCGNPVPKWKHKFRMTWNTPWKFSISGAWRYISPVHLDVNRTDQPLIALINQYGVCGVASCGDVSDDKLKAFSYFDLAGTWQVKDGVTFRAGINNLFDKDPPIVDTNSIGISAPPFGNGNTYPAVYDSLGRTVFVDLTADF
ncbi:MAG: TonB-dependent receptor domain-containing protein [Phenylobacterium sp.]